MTILICINQYLSNIEVQFMKKLSNAAVELKKRIAHKKKRVFQFTEFWFAIPLLCYRFYISFRKVSQSLSKLLIKFRFWGNFTLRKI